MKIGKKSYFLMGTLIVFLIGGIIGLSSLSKSKIKAEETGVQASAATTRVLDASMGSVTPGVSLNSNEAFFESAEVDTSQYTAAQTMDITNETEFRAAFANESIVVFNIVQDFVFTTSTGQENNVTSSSQMVNTARNRKVVVEGNGHTIDFRGVSFTPGTGIWDITMQNMTVYSRNYWGPITARSANNASTQTFHNYKNLGSQMLHAPNTNVTLSGDIVNDITNGYTSPLDGSTWSTLNSSQANFEISNLTMLGGSTFYGTATSSGNILIQNNGSFITGEGAEITLNNINANNTSGEANGAGVEVRSGSMTMGKNSVLNYISGTSRNNYGAIALYQSGSSMTLGDGAVVNITQSAHTGSTNSRGNNPIYLGSSAVFTMNENSEMNINLTGSNGSTAYVINSNASSSFTIAQGAKLKINTEGNRGNIVNLSNGTNSNRTRFAVLEGGTFELNATNTLTSSNDVFYTGDYADFTVGKKGIFKVSSDGTGSKNLLRIGANSTFQFKDAQQVDLQFTDTMANNASLIYMSGSAGRWIVDVQAVKQWNRGSDITGTPDFEWTPMFGMTIPYSSSAVTRANIVSSSVSSMTNTSFKENFNTGPTANGITGAQRVLFEYIPDVLVSIESLANDLITDVGSNTVSGAVNPGAYVRITYTPPTGGQEVVINQTVASPVDASDVPEYTDNFTTNDTGNGRYSYTLTDNQHFEAGGTIKVYAFLNGKYDEATQVVLDKTPPTADPVEYHIGRGDAIPEASVFVTNPTDTNPAEQAFTYAYTVETEAALAGFVDTVGTHEVNVIVRDDAGNESVVRATLVVHETTNTITANDFEASATVLSGMTEAELNAYILEQSGAAASKIVDGVFTDLTSQIQVTDLGGLKPTSTGGAYNVELRVLAADSGLAEDLVTTIVVTFLDEIPPTGTGKFTFVKKDDVAAINDVLDYTVFLTDWSDDVTPKDQITVELAPNQDIQASVGTLGNQSFKVRLTDAAGNFADIDVPIYVYEEPFVAGEDALVTGKDFIMDYADWTGNLRDIAITKGQAQGWQIINNAMEDVTADTTKFVVDTSAVTADENVPHKIVLSIMDGTTVKATKDIYVTFNDKTAPTADSKVTRVRITDAAAILNGDLKTFVDNLSDNVSEAANITAALTQGQNIEELVATPGEKTLKIDFTDEAGNTATIETKIFVYDNGLTVEFVNENGESIYTSIPITGYASGQSVDLTKVQDVQTAIEELLSQNYQLTERPASETNVVIADVSQVVTYKFSGTLFIYSAPNVIDFGTKNAGIFGVKAEKPDYDVPLEIWDNRYNFTNWTLTAQLQSPLTSQVDATKILNNAIRYKNTAVSTEDIILTSEALPIVQHTHTGVGRYNVSEGWDSGETGFKLELPAGAVRELGEYQATILWKLGETP